MKIRCSFLRMLALLVLAAAALCSLSGYADEGGGDSAAFAAFEDAVFGTFAGSPSEKVTAREFPDAKRAYYPSLSDLILALKTGKIDAFILDKLFFYSAAQENDGLACIDQSLEPLDYAYIFPKNAAGSALKKQMDAFIETLRTSGELSRIQEKWLYPSEPDASVDFSGLNGTNGTIRLAIGTDNRPFVYRKNNQYAGYEVEIAAMFAREHGYALSISEANFDGAMLGVESGKFDMGAYAINPTPDREEAMLFSEPSFTGDMVLIARKSALTGLNRTTDEILNGHVGVITGSVYYDLVKTKYPGAKVSNFSTAADALLALEQGKVDAYVEDDVVYAAIRWEKDNLTSREVDLIEFDLAFAFSANVDETLKKQMNAFLETARQDGTIAGLNEKWFSGEEPSEHPQYRDLPSTNGVIRVASDPAAKPMTYKKNGIFSGYEIDLLTLFAKEYGYALKIEDVSLSGAFAGLASGRYDIAASCMGVTEERKENIDFSNAHHHAKSVVILHDAAAVKSETSFLAGVRESFVKTFIREARWKLIVEGILVTMFISILSAFFGSVLGFGLYMLTRSGNRMLSVAAKGVSGLYSRIVEGTPVVVILMILFYVVFAGFRDMSGIIIAIIGFTLTFGAFVNNHLAISVNSVDYGQTEAAYALGYTRSKTFFRIIMPQAMRIFLPSYCGQAVELIKATAVVGYIAVNDLTKMGDIIRSSTYEAFFPLIAVAVIYFLLTWLLSLLLVLLKKRFDPKRRSSKAILKGIKTTEPY